MAEKELGYRPQVVVVWADPEYGRYHFFRQLAREGLVHHVVGRPALPEEGTATTRLESFNIRVVLKRVKRLWPGQPIVFQAADIQMKPGTWTMLAQRLAEGHKAVVFHWEHACAGPGVWHTNLFGVAQDEAYWPPVSPLEEQDVLERQWGRSLEGKEHIFRWHNSGEKRFTHRHETESLDPFPFEMERSSNSLMLFTKGCYRFGVEALISQIRSLAWPKW